MLRMHPVTHEGFPRRSFALRNFIFVVRKRKIDSAGVYVQRLPKILHGHCGAFNVPARPALANGCLPEMLAGLWRFPQSEVAGALFFVAVDIHARASLDS